MKNLKFFIHFFTLVLLLSLFGCSQNIDQVNIETQPTTDPRQFTGIFSLDLTGTPLSPSIGSSTALYIQSLGGNTARTTSSSSSFIMTGGVSID